MRKRILTLLLLAFGPLAFASMVILFDPGTGRNLRRIDSADTLQYLGRTDALINPVLPTNNLSLCKVTNSAVVLLNAAELLADWLSASNRAYSDFTNYLANLKSESISTVEATNDLQGRVIRAFAEVVLDELNLHAQRQVDLLNAIDGASTLAQLKTAAASIPDLPQRTLQQIKTAITNKLSDD